jgi:hypothetical protein
MFAEFVCVPGGDIVNVLSSVAASKQDKTPEKIYFFVHKRSRYGILWFYSKNIYKLLNLRLFRKCN